MLPLSQCSTVSGHTPKTFAASFWVSPRTVRAARILSPKVCGAGSLGCLRLMESPGRMIWRPRKKATLPCPCGYLGSTTRACRCSPDQVSRYQGKLSGPLLDRIDLHIEVPSLPAQELLNAPPGENTETIAARSLAARDRALARQGCANADLQGQAIDTQARLGDKAAALLQKAATQLGWSGRSVHRSLKVARTIADLAGSDTIEVTHMAEAMQYRRILKEH